MQINTRIVRQQALAILNVAVLLTIGPGGQSIVLAQDQEGPPPAAMAPEQLDQLVAPIALYPDPLLAQVLAAATTPTDVVQADRWVKQHKNLKGQQLTDAVVAANLPYDPSIISLIQFPTVLDTLNQKLDWTTSLGNAFLTQRGDVMDSVQRMRRQAEKVGNLKSNEQIKVASSPTVIEIQPTNPQVIYVPAYNPQVVYVQPPPPPAPSTGAVIATGLISFGLGVAVGAAASNNGCCWYGGSVGWHSHTVVVANNSFNRTWATRGAVPARAPYYRGGGNVNTVNRNTVNNVNVNVNNSNRNTNVNNVNRNNTNVNNRNGANVDANNRNASDRANDRNGNDRNANAANRNAGGGGNSSRPGRSGGADQPAASNRGYSQASGSGRSTAFSGAQNGNSERAASQRGQASRGSRRR